MALEGTLTSMSLTTKAIGSMARNKEKESSSILILNQELLRDSKDSSKTMKWLALIGKNKLKQQLKSSLLISSKVKR
jgi:hypothetical protein